MRTTVQLRDDQREALAAMAARRGLRGYSELIQEAVDRYLLKDTVDNAGFLALEGILTDEEADDLRRSVEETRASWRTSS